MNDTVVERYVDLCLRMDRHVDGFVDAYVGPPSIKDRILAEDPRDPRVLRDEAESLLQETPRADLEPDRARWLDGQLRGIACVASRLAGADITWTDEVERCFGVRPEHVDEESFRASHKALEDVLPGGGDLSARYNAWTDSLAVNREQIPQTIDALRAEFRRRTASIVELPPGESTTFEIVEDKPWQAFNWFRGDNRSLVEVNVDLPISFISLVDLVAHEAYPGHHTERACKEFLLYRGRSRLEISVMVVSAPEAMIAEGIATNALEEVLGDEGFEAVAGVAAKLGLELDPAAARVVHREEAALFSAATNVARMLHEDGMPTDEAEAYLRQWALYSAGRAAKMVGFLTDPGARSYSTAYTDGNRICRSFIDGSPDGFRRLLTEQLTVADLLPAPDGRGGIRSQQS